MTNPREPSGGFAPDNPDVPGEFTAQPGIGARHNGIPALDARYTAKQRGYSGREPYSPSEKMRAAYITDPTDPSDEADPAKLGL